MTARTSNPTPPPALWFHRLSPNEQLERAALLQAKLVSDRKLGPARGLGSKDRQIVRKLATNLPAAEFLLFLNNELLQAAGLDQGELEWLRTDSARRRIARFLFGVIESMKIGDGEP